MAMTKIGIALNLLNKATSEQLPKIIEQIDSALNGISQENFSHYGKQLVAYGNILFAKAYDAQGKIIDKSYEDKLNRFYARLRNINKLGVDRDIAFFSKIWNQLIMQIRSGLAHIMDDSTKTGSFFYFYSLAYVNNLLSDPIFSCNTLIEWLILRNRVDWIEERNFDRVILIAIRSLVKEEDVQSLINYFYSANRKDALEIFMRYALQIGRCKTIISLLDKQIPLPNKIEDVSLIFQLAISNNMHELAENIFESFTMSQVLDYCLLRGWYEQAYYFSQKLINIPKAKLALITEIAATCGDLDALKHFLSICSESDRQELYNQHILPFLFLLLLLNSQKMQRNFIHISI